MAQRKFFAKMGLPVCAVHEARVLALPFGTCARLESPGRNCNEFNPVFDERLASCLQFRDEWEKCLDFKAHNVAQLVAERRFCWTKHAAGSGSNSLLWFDREDLYACRVVVDVVAGE